MARLPPHSVALLLLALSAQRAAAQPGAGLGRTPAPEGAERIAVMTLRAPTSSLGVAAADTLGAAIARDLATHREAMILVPVRNITATLEASGFPHDKPPDRVTAYLLARNLRARQYVEGSIAPAPAGVRIEASLVLTRYDRLVQPLPPAEGRSVREAAALVAADLRVARAQLPLFRQCEAALVATRYEEAIAAARRAIATYPRAILARLCLAQALANAKAPPESLLAVTGEILRIDAQSVPALTLRAEAFDRAGMRDSAVAAATAAYAGPLPTPQLIRDRLRSDSGPPYGGHVAEYGPLSRPSAVAILVRAVRENPDDPELRRLYFLVLLTAQRHREAAIVGESIRQLDTAAADTLFFLRLARAYAADSQPQAAVHAAARGVAKFPRNAALHSAHGDMLRRAGRPREAVAALRRALALDSTLASGWLDLARAYADLAEADGALPSLRRALAIGRTAQDSVAVTRTALDASAALRATAGAARPRPAACALARRAAEAAAVAGASIPVRGGAQRDELAAHAARQRAESERLVRDACR